MTAPRHQPARADVRLYSVEIGTSAQTVAKMLRVLFPDATTVLDSTWGKGRFWDGNTAVRVTGLDMSPHGRPSVLGDFTRLPFDDEAFDVVVLDPPYQWDEGKRKRSIMGLRFSTYRDEAHAREIVQAGATEAWRVARLGILVKVQNFCHASLPVRMTRWVEDVLPHPPYGEVHQARTSTLKVMDPKWSDQLSVYSRSTTFLAFRHGDQRHKRRAPAQQLALLEEAAS